jgi:putative lipoic acid-binding regulatory protein
MTAADSPDGASAPANAEGPADRPSELLQFPVDFPIKIMGARVDEFANDIAAVILRHAPDFDASTLELRSSSKGNYLGLTATIRATSRDQLDAIYRELTSHPLVKVVL